MLSSFVIPDLGAILVTAVVRMALSRNERMDNAVTFLDKKTEIIMPLHRNRSYNPI